MRLDSLAQAIGSMHGNAQFRAGMAVNQVLNRRNWLIGAYIIEYEQGGEDRVEYREKVLQELTKRLRDQGVEGLSYSNLKNFRQVASIWPHLPIPHTLSALFDDNISLTPSDLLEGEIRQSPSAESKDGEILQTVSAKSDPVTEFQKTRRAIWPSGFRSISRRSGWRPKGASEW